MHYAGSVIRSWLTSNHRETMPRSIAMQSPFERTKKTDFQHGKFARNMKMSGNAWFICPQNTIFERSGAGCGLFDKAKAFCRANFALAASSIGRPSHLLCSCIDHQTNVRKRAVSDAARSKGICINISSMVVVCETSLTQ